MPCWKATPARLNSSSSVSLRHSAAARKAYEQQVQIHALLTWQQGRAALPAPVVLSPADFQTQPNVIPFPPDRLIPATPDGPRNRCRVGHDPGVRVLAPVQP